LVISLSPREMIAKLQPGVWLEPCLWCHLSCFAVVEPEVVAGLEVEGDGGVGDALQVDRQHLLGHVIVVQLVVTQGHIHLQRQEVSADKQEAVSMVAPLVWIFNDTVLMTPRFDRAGPRDFMESCLAYCRHMSHVNMSTNMSTYQHVRSS